MNHILFALLVGLAACGDLATANCPANFNITAVNVTTTDQQSIIATMLPFYNFVRGVGNSDAL
jgi:hypothetical protein